MDSNKEPFQLLLTCEDKNEYEVKHRDLSTGIFILKNVISKEDIHQIKNAIDEYAYDKPLGPVNNVCAFGCDKHEIDDPVKSEKIGFIITKTMTGIKNRISKILQLTPLYTEIAQMRKIYGATRNHIDGISGNWDKGFSREHVRVLSVIVALNSDYEGGEFYFPNQCSKIKLKEGEALIFPPYWTHPHQTGELNGTFRYTLNTWFTGMALSAKLTKDLNEYNCFT
jgi:hypothetical protein